MYSAFVILALAGCSAASVIGINPNALPVPLDTATVALAKNAQLIQQAAEGTRNILGGGIPAALPADTHEVAAGKVAHAIAVNRQRAIVGGAAHGIGSVGLIGSGLVAPAIAAPAVLSTGLVGNGIVAGGLVGNGLIANGLVGNGLIANGVVSNGLIANGLVGHGIVGNGLIGNGLIANGLLANGHGLVAPLGVGLGPHW